MHEILDVPMLVGQLVCPLVCLFISITSLTARSQLVLRYDPVYLLLFLCIPYTAPYTVQAYRPYRRPQKELQGGPEAAPRGPWFSGNRVVRVFSRLMLPELRVK